MFTSLTTTPSSSQQATSSLSSKKNLKGLSGDLSSTYRFPGGLQVPSLPSRSSSSSPRSSRKHESHAQSGATSATPSVRSPGSTKNYEETCGNLASVTAVVFGTGLPLLPRAYKKPKTGSAASTPSTLSRAASSVGSHASSHKDYEHGLGHPAKTHEFRSAAALFSMWK